MKTNSTWRVLGLTALGLVFLLGLGIAEGKAMVIVEKGKPVATIVTAAESNEKVKLAAQELQTYIEKISGAKEHPEYYATNPDGTTYEGYPNLTNSEIMKIAADIIKYYLRKNPDANSYGFAPDDGLPRDYTPDTVKLNQGFVELGGRPGVPASAKGKKRMLHAPVVETEAWCWVNGEYIGHRPYMEAYIRPIQMELDVTKAIRPGQTNQITIRVSTSLGAAQAADGLESRLFLYSPK